MKQLKYLSIGGMIFGFVLGLMSSIRYFLLYPDVDRLIFYGLISLLIMVVSFYYNSIKDLENRLIAIEDYLSDLNNEEKE